MLQHVAVLIINVRIIPFRLCLNAQGNFDRSFQQVITRGSLGFNQVILTVCQAALFHIAILISFQRRFIDLGPLFIGIQAQGFCSSASYSAVLIFFVQVKLYVLKSLLGIVCNFMHFYFESVNKGTIMDFFLFTFRRVAVAVYTNVVAINKRNVIPVACTRLVSSVQQSCTVVDNNLFAGI